LSAIRAGVLIVIVLLLAAIFLVGYPALMEESGDVCSALEQRVEDLASHDSLGRLLVGRLYGSSSSEPGGAAYVRDKYPLLPSQVGCTLAYWLSFISPSFATAPSAAPVATAESPAPTGSEGLNNGIVPVIARDVTPNGDPISPDTIFPLPMDTVAIRVDYPSDRPAAARFQLRQGRAVLASCNADKSPPGTAWCRFSVSLRKGNYSIAFTANNVLLGQFPFTVIGR
jgi:hypothetical protein